jgi:dihydrodipicolinate synthase/N-acetylneuraminate lyase
MSQTELGRGVIVPMVTPFTNDGKIDNEAIEKIIEFLIAGGTAPFIMGTTGESASIPERDRPVFVKTVVKIVSGRVKTYAGISSPCFQSSVEAAKDYFELGVNAVVAHPPGYYPLTDNQLLRYYENLADRISGPLIVYNNPLVAHCSIPVTVLDQLSHHESIIGVKDSEQDIQRLNHSLGLWSVRTDFNHLLGWGAQIANGLLKGASGIVPSSGNLVPKMHREMIEAAHSGDHQKLEGLQKKTNDILDIYLKNRSLGQSLPVLKVMMNALNLCEPYVLPPLETLHDDEKNQIVKQMQLLHIYD